MEEPRKQATLMLLWKSFFSQDGIRDLRKPTTPIRGKAEPTLGLRHREAQSAYLLEWDNCFLTSWHGTLPGVGEIRREFEIPSKRCIEPCTIPVLRRCSSWTLEISLVMEVTTYVFLRWERIFLGFEVHVKLWRT